MSRLARVTLAASIDAVTSGRPLAAAMRIAAKAERDGCCPTCGGEAEHDADCESIEGRASERFYSDRKLGGAPW